MDFPGNDVPIDLGVRHVCLFGELKNRQEVGPGGAGGIAATLARLVTGHEKCVLGTAPILGGRKPVPASGAFVEFAAYEEHPASSWRRRALPNGAAKV